MVSLGTFLIISQPIMRALAALVFTSAISTNSAAASDRINNNSNRPIIFGNSVYSIIEERDHDPSIFTQGFDYENGTFYESSGLFGKSFVRSYKHNAFEPDSKSDTSKSNLSYSVASPSQGTNLPPKHLERKSQRLAQYSLSKKLFAEGLVKVGGLLHLLTWQSGQLLSLDAQSLKVVDTRRYQGEGWGITHDGDDFIMSNGSEKLYFRDTKTFAIKRHIVVSDGRRNYTKLNELEFAEGFVWANMWLSTYILKIDPSTGQVVEKFDLSEIADKNMSHPMHTVLNGIAYDDKKKAFWITGKNWPRKYLVKF